ncbi:hypothetical protein EW146_g5371 [Bondarzewia mesenterica]|uniref:P-loop containing nucleoside triphosphate hydrolase protein n=1 Tax=Bondarzewia mesenterica TaxID=1095465 RepID=A0A4S4LSS4_9AGAM|nr:hypothetical protein EW146_g5371 [Bondarzewia mesenterica]
MTGPEAALEVIDSNWYRNIAKKARWMDLVGDYAGNERFILDGEALLQTVLDDPLLALAREEDPSFQILHALHSMERLLHELIRRSAVFDIVFWEAFRHLTLKTGGSTFVTTSRALARIILFDHLIKHAQKMDLAVHTFKNLSDEAWTNYQRKTRPMFVMTNDGGVMDSSPLDAERILVQRTFIFRLLSSGLAVTLLRGSEFRDSKIFAFVFEQHFDLHAEGKVPVVVWNEFASALKALNLADTQRRGDIKVPVIPASSERELAIDSLLTDFSKLLLLASHTNEASSELVYLFVLHCILVKTLSVDERARPLERLHPDLTKCLLHSFLPHAYLALETLGSNSGIILDVDGRVFISLIAFVVSHMDTSLSGLVGDELHSRLQKIWLAARAPPVALNKLASRFPNPSNNLDLVAAANMEPSIALLPFDNPVFDSELAAVHVTVAESNASLPPTRLEFSQGTAFTDTKHWHNHKRSILPKHLGGEAPKPATAWQRQRRLRTEQFFMASLQRLAQSLMGSVGIPSSPKPILAVGTRVSSEIQKKPDYVRRSKKEKDKPLSKSEKLKNQNIKDKKSKDEERYRVWWRDRLAEMFKLTSIGKKKQHLAYLQDPSRSDRASDQVWLSIEMDLYGLNLELRQWIEEMSPYDVDDPSSKAAQEIAAMRDLYTVKIMRMVHKLYSKPELTQTVLSILESVLIVLGFVDYIPPMMSSLSNPLPVESDRPLTFDFIKLVRSKTKKPVRDYKFMCITEHPAQWQLRLFGEYMDRSMDSKPDARVSFEPDAWQREVLDCLDADSSVLVVAPTSAGKTFISFYAMEKVLKDSDDGILVYVAPTKALVNQVAAEVYARFKKELPGRTCWAIHTRDYRVHEPQKCQILVTVPEMFAIMLLSPSLARSWTPRIKRIILDEIHTIGQHEGGSVWEQIILLAPCPIIGLSATIGEANKFNTWLEHVQTAKGFQHKFIHYPHRYSHLRKFAYFPQMRNSNTTHESGSVFTGLNKYQSEDLMRFIHPISVLSFGATSLPSDLSLESVDLLHLYGALRDCTAGGVVGLDDLDPTRFFAPAAFLKQKDVLRYEAAIKDVLSSLVASSDINDSSSPLRRVVGQLQDPIVAKTDESVLNTSPSNASFMDGLVPLLADLHASGDLPALLFNFDRSECEEMAMTIVQVLEEGEQAWRAKSEEWKTKIDRWEEWKVIEKERARRLSKMRKDELEESKKMEDLSWESSFDPADPSPQFTFSTFPRGYGKQDLLEDIVDLLRRRITLPTWAVPALRRGVGVHHAGMNKAYRSLVERLFRIGFLRVVIATGTLALGINAPTRTSVFCGDSPFLTALMYRQCAGRAGRRGYDLLGRVVFYGLQLDRIQRLMLSRLPGLNGNFPMSSTLSLRLFNLLHGSDDAPYAVKAIQSILQLPQISFSSDVGKDQLLHHLRFSIEYLRRARLLDQDGKPINLFGVASHLYYTEPSNLAMVTLLQSGVIHDICLQPSEEKAQREFMLLASHLFGRRYLPEVYATKENVRELIGKGPSCVVLPSMMNKARKALLKHHEEILEIFTAYAVTFAGQYASQLEPDDRLPLSEQAFGRQISFDSPFHSHLRDTAVHPVARSPFVANSGHADRFHSVQELANTVRRGVHLNEHAIPSVERIVALPGDQARPFALNAHIYDFYIHGQAKALVTFNGIRRGDVWYILEDFYMSLMVIRAEVENLLVKASREAGAAVGVDSEELEADSGFESQDPAEAEEKEEVDVGHLHTFIRPSGLSERDWKVYKVVNAVTNEFGEKFKAMWA